jgi:hypothetical protein
MNSASGMEIGLKEQGDPSLFYVIFIRFAKNRFVSSESYVTVMIRLHLAHGKKQNGKF